MNRAPRRTYYSRRIDSGLRRAKEEELTIDLDNEERASHGEPANYEITAPRRCPGRESGGRRRLVKIRPHPTTRPADAGRGDAADACLRPRRKAQAIPRAHEDICSLRELSDRRMR